MSEVDADTVGEVERDRSSVVVGIGYGPTDFDNVADLREDPSVQNSWTYRDTRLGDENSVLPEAEYGQSCRRDDALIHRDLSISEAGRRRCALGEAGPAPPSRMENDVVPGRRVSGHSPGRKECRRVRTDDVLNPSHGGSVLLCPIQCGGWILDR